MAAFQEYERRVIKDQSKVGAANMLTLPMMNQGDVDCDPRIKEMSCEEMEKALVRKNRRTKDSIRDTGAPQTARALLEENKQLVKEKDKLKAMERKNSREFVEKILAADRVVNESDKAKDIGRRTAQRGLARYYKAKICEREVEKTNSYHQKLAGGLAIEHFPYIEGETICQNRQAEAGKMREEMRAFLKQQQEVNPPRNDALMMDSDPEYSHRYPFMPVYSQSARGPSQDVLRSNSEHASASATATPRGGETAPHMAKYPKFLSKAREHMSRRIEDAHVRKALEDKVERTKAELETLTRQRHLEAQNWDDGMMVNDALRYDNTVGKAAERQKNAVHLKRQIEERKDRREQETQARRGEPAGYWGPDEKELRDADELRVHCGDIIKQMEVNQVRKLKSRSRRLQQEKVVIDNSLAEMSADRVKEKEKIQQHKDILLTTWESQRKIRQVFNRIEAM